MIDKYNRHKGVIKFKLGDDEFSMRPTVDEWAKVVKLFTGDTELTKEKLSVLRDVIADAMHRIDVDVPIETIKETVEINLFTCLDAMMGTMNRPDNFMEKVKQKINNAKPN
jgi:hypothetical protein